MLKSHIKKASADRKEGEATEKSTTHSLTEHRLRGVVDDGSQGSVVVQEQHQPAVLNDSLQTRVGLGGGREGVGETKKQKKDLQIALAHHRLKFASAGFTTNGTGAAPNHRLSWHRSKVALLHITVR